MPTDKLVHEIQEVAYHRNGIFGEGFHAVRFIASLPAGEGKRNFLGILFEDETRCAVLCLDLIPTEGVAFGNNSWRGDHFEPELRRAILNHEREEERKWQRRG